MLLCAALAGCGSPAHLSGDEPPQRLALTPLDRAELAARQQHPPPLRWFNVENDGTWVAGERPEWSGTGFEHAVTLAPGRTTTLRLAPRQRLRIEATDVLPPGAFFASTRNASGLARPETPRLDVVGRSALIDPARDEPVLLELGVPAAAHAPLTLRLYVEDSSPLPPLLPYRELLPLAGSPLSVREPDVEAVGTDYWPWTPDAPLTLDAGGRRRIRISAHYRYEAADSRPLRTLQLCARGDDGEATQVEVHAERVRAYLVDEAPALLSGRFEAWLEVPAGVRTVTLTTSAPVLVRVMAAEAEPYLLPALNAPARSSPAEAVPPASVWALDAASLGAAPLAAFEEAVAPALRALVDNRHRDGGAIGSALLGAKAATRPAAPAAATLARRVAGAHTFFRDLRPATKVNRGDARQLSFLLPHRDSANDDSWRRDDRWLRDSHALAPYRERVADASFTPLESGEVQPYLLPARAAPGELRVLVAADDAATGIMLQFDDAAPRRLDLLPPASNAALGPPDPRGELPPASGALVQDPPLQLVPVGNAVLPLPAGVREIKLWPAVALSRPIEVALQYRSARPYELDEAAYPVALSRLAQEPLAALRDVANDSAAAAEVPRDLDSHWQPLARWLRGMRSQFEWRVAPPDAAETPARAGDLSSLRDSALQAVRTGDDIAAVEAWSALLAASPPATRTKAAVARAQALRTAGEPLVAELQLRGLCLHAPDAAGRELACTTLHEIYKSMAEEEDRAELLATLFLRDGATRHARELVELLGALGEPALALDLGLALPDSERPVGVLREAALARGWERTAQALDAAPGPARFAAADARVVDYAGVELLYGVERDLFATAYRADASAPVKLVVDGPTTLRLELRPLYAGAPAGPVDDWVEIRDADELLLVPVSANQPVQALRVAGRKGYAPGRRVRTTLALAPGRHAFTIATRHSPLLVRVEEALPQPPPATLPAAQMSPDWPEAGLLARGDVAAALALHPGESSDATLRRALLLTWQAERAPATRIAALAALNADHVRHAQLADLHVLLSRLERDATWQTIGTVESSAGLRYVAVRGWSPESPSLRVRRALLPATTPDPSTIEHVLDGGERLVYGVSNLAPSTLTVEAELVGVPYLVLQPAAVSVQFDDAPATTATLRADERRTTLRLALPVGEHRVRIATRAFAPNQFVRVRLRESRPVPDASMLERGWHVATAREPLRARLMGPAWLRIDELRATGTRTHYRLLDAGPQLIELTPAAGEPEALYRLFQRTLGPPRPSPPLVADRRPEAVAAPWFVVPDPVPDSRVAFVDAYPLRHQEDGLWSFAARAARRRDVDLAGPEETSAEQFLEASATHRYVDAARRNYQRAQLLARAREFGGPTLGAGLDLVHLPTWAPIGLRVDGELFAQQPDGDDVRWPAGWRRRSISSGRCRRRSTTCRRAASSRAG